MKETGNFKIQNDVVVDGRQEYYNIVCNTRFLSEEEEKELILLMLDGDEEARIRLIEFYLPFVIDVAKMFVNEQQELDDCIQLGNLGLINAVNRFDPTKGISFRSYAFMVIRYTLIKGINNYNRHVSMGDYNLIIKYQKVYRLLEQKLYRVPTVIEIAEELKISLEEAFFLFDIQKKTVSLTDVEQDSDMVELDVFPIEFEKLNFCSISDRTVEEKAMESVLPSEIEKIFKWCHLEEREIVVLIMFYGLCGAERKTITEIGKMLGLTHQSVSRLKEKALEKMRYSEKIKSFACYMDQPEKSLQYLDTCQPKFCKNLYKKFKRKKGKK